MKLFKKVRIEFVVLALLGVWGIAIAAGYAQRLTGVGGAQIWLIEGDDSSIPGSTTQAGASKFGNAADISDITLPTNTTGSNFSSWVPVYNVGSAVIQGQLLISSNTGTDYVAGADATLNKTNIVGVAAAAIASGAKGWMVRRGGGYAVMLGSGTISIGDLLISSGASAGYAWGGPATAGAIIGRAMSGNTTGSGGTILALMD